MAAPILTKPTDVDVDRASAELAAAGSRGRHLAVLRQEWTGDEERSAHGRDESGGRSGCGMMSWRGHGRVCARGRARTRCRETAQQREHRADVGEIGHM